MMQETGNGGWEVSWASSLLEERACFYLVEFVNTEETLGNFGGSSLLTSINANDREEHK
jgi:hypothetical protein